MLRKSCILSELNYRAAPNSYKLPFDIKRIILEAQTDYNKSDDLFLFAACQDDGFACVIAIGFSLISIASKVLFSAE